MRKEEYIICSAIWFDDNINHEDRSLDGKTGFVICGRRHHNCFHTLAITSNRSDTHLNYEKEQGFLTNKDRFVSRIEASEIAFLAGQIEQRTTHPLGLFSEDLY